jgi:Protein of unknown function (DUF3822)
MAKSIKFAQLVMVAEHLLFRYSSSTDWSEKQGLKLTIELGDTYLNYCISDKSGSEIYSTGLMHSDIEVTASDLIEFLGIPDLSHSFDDVVLVCNTKQKVLVPSAYHTREANETVVEAIHGDLCDLAILEDDVHQWELHTIYGCNRALLENFQSRYPHLRMIHFDSACLRSLFRKVAEKSSQWVKVFFYPKQITVIALKEGALQIMQTFQFDSPQDVIYHLLHVADNYQLDVTAVQMEVSGLIDVSSDAWKELQKYFLDVQLEHNPQLNTEEIEPSSTPLHYYTPFLIAPSCV